MMWWRNLFNKIIGRFRKSMSDLSFIPRDEKTKRIDTGRLTQAYVLKTSDGTKVAIAVKIDGVWYTYAYNASLDNELSTALGDAYSEVLIDEWARLIAEYGEIVEIMDEKVKQAAPKKSSSKNLS